MSARIFIAFSLLSLALQSSSANAQDGFVILDDTAVAESSGSLYGATPIGMPGGYFWARGDFGERPGVEGNFFSSGMFAPIQILGPDSSFFIDTQIFVTDATNVGGEVGLGYRRLFPELRSIFGVNAFINWDETSNDNSFRQYAFGAEWQTEYLGINANAYLPWDDNPKAVGGMVLTNTAEFIDYNLVFQNLQAAEQQSRGFDIEIGSPIPYAEWISVYGGFYNLDSDLGENINGGRGRVAVDLTSAQLDLTVYNDDRFGTSVNAGLSLILGGGPLQFTPRTRSLESRMFDRVRREHRISTQQVVIDSQELAINPATGQPFVFVHVDNTADPGGDGTDENRYDNLGLASTPTADIILVYRGDTTRGNLLPAGDGLTLSDDQIVLGEGTPFVLQTANRIDPIALPGFSMTGTNPFVGGNAGADLITLANNNMIIGLNMIAPAGGNAIAGNNISNFAIANINQNIAAGEDTGAGGGIVLTNASGIGIIENTSFRFTNTTTSAGGIVINNTSTGDLDLLVSGAPFLEGGQFGISLTANDSNINALIENVNADQNGTGLNLAASNGGVVSAEVNNSTFTNAVGGTPGTGNGIALTADGGTVALDGTGIDASGALVDGLAVSAIGGGTASGSIVGGSLANAGDDAVDASTDTGGSAIINLGQLDGSGAGDNGLELTAAGGSRIDTMLNVTNFSGATADAINAQLSGASTQTIQATNSNFGSAGDEGLFVDASGSSVFTGMFTNSTFADAGGNGIEINSDSSGVSLTLSNTDANNNGGTGLLVNAANSSAVSIGLLGGVSFDDSMGGDAISLNATNGTLIDLVGSQVSGANAADDGLAITADNSNVSVELTNTGSFANAGGDGIDFLGTNNSNIDIGIAGTTTSPADFSGAAGNGVVGNLTDSDAALVLMNTDFSNAGAEGLGVTVTGGSFAGDIVSSTFAGAGGNGVRLDLDNATGTLTLDNTDANNNGGTGLLVNATNSSSGTISLINGVSFDDSLGGDAIGLTATGMSTIDVTGSGVSGANAANDGLFVNANNSDITVNLTNTGSFANAGGDGIDFTGTNGATVGISVAGTAGTPADFSGAAGNGVVGNLTDSDGTLSLTNTNFGSAGMEGLGVTATGSTFTGTVTNGSFANAGDNGVRLDLDNSIGTLTLDNTDANNNGGNGLIVSSTTGSTATVNLLNGVSFDDSMGGDAINLVASGMSTIDVTGSGVSGANASNDGIFIDGDDSDITLSLTNTGSFANAGGDGIDFTGTNGATIDITVAGTAGTPADFSGAAGNGVMGLLTDSDGTLSLNNTDFSGAGLEGFGVTATGSTFTGTVTNGSFADAGTNGVRLDLDNSTGTLTLDNTDANNNGGNGLSVSAVTGSTATVNLLNGVSFDDSMGGDAINLIASGMSTIDVTGTGVSGANASNDGIFIDADDSDVTLSLTSTGSFANAGGDGIDFTGVNGAAIDITITGTLATPADFSGAGANGILGNLNGATTTGTLSLTDTTFAMATLDGMNITTDAATFDSTILRGSFSDAGQNGTVFNLDNMATVNVDTTNLSIDNSGQANMVADVGDAIQVTADNGSTFDMEVTDGSLMNSFDDMTDFVGVMGGSTANLVIDPTDATGAGDNGIEFFADNGTINVTMIDSPVSNAGNPVGNNGVLGDLLNGSTVNLTFNNSDVASATGSGVDVISDASTFTATFNNSNVDSAGANGIIIDGLNGSTITTTFNNSSLAGAGTDGLNLNLVDSTGNVTFNGSDVSGVGNTAIALTTDNSMLTVDLGTGLSLDDAGTGNALNVDASNMSTVAITGTGVSGQNAGASGIDLTSDNSNVSLTLTDAVSFANAGQGGAGDGLTFLADNGGNIDITIDGTGLAPVAFDGAAGDGINGMLDNGATGSINITDFTASNNQGNGFSLLLDNGSSLTGSTFTNGEFLDNGQGDMGAPGMDGSAGISITSLGGSEIGDRAGQSAGITFSNVDSGSSDPTSRTQDHGLLFLADSDGYLGLDFDTVNFNNNEGNGVEGETNADATLNDTALAVLDFNMSNINNNHGDGFEITATNGDDTFGMPQTTGIILSLTNSNVNDNGNAINDPMAGIVGDGVGYGIDAFADGDGSGPGNTQITINLDNTDLTGNEEGSFDAPFQQDGGIVNLNIMGGMIDSMGLNQVCVDGPNDVFSLFLNNVTLLSNNAAGPGLSLQAMNGGQILADISNLNIENNAGTGVVILAETGGSINASFTNVNVQNNGTLADPKTGEAAIAAIQARINGAGSMVNLDLTDVVVTNHASYNGIEIISEAGGAFTSTMQNVDLTGNTANAGEGELEVLVDGAGSSADFAIDTLTANNSTGRGIDALAQGGGSLSFTQFDNITATGAAEEGLNIIVNTGSNLPSFTMAGTNDFSNAGADAVNIELDSATVPTDISLTNVNADMAGGNGVDIQLTNMGASGGASSITLNNVDGTNAAGQGLNVNVDGLASGDSIAVDISGGSDFSGAMGGDGASIALNGAASSSATVDIDGLSANNATAGNGLNIGFTGGITGDVSTLSNVSATGAGADGLLITSDAASTLTSVVGTTNTFDGATGDGISITADTQTSPINIDLTDTSANNAGGVGVDLQLLNMAGSMGNSISLTNVDATGAMGGEGLNIDVTGLTATDSIDVSILGGSDVSDFSGASTADGVHIDINGALGTVANLTVDGLDASDAGTNGVNIDVAGGVILDIPQFDNVTATNAMGGNGLDLVVTGTNSITGFTANNLSVNDASATGLNLVIADQAAPVDITLNNVSATGAGTPPTVGSGDGVHISLDNVGGGMTNNIAFDTVTTTGATGDGIDISLDNGTVAGFTQFDSVTSTSNQQNGLRFTIDNMSQLLTFASSGLDLSNNSAQSTTDAGLNVNVLNGSSADFDLANLTIANTGANFGSGVLLNVQDTSTLGFDVNGGTIDSTGREGIDISVGTTTPGATFTGNFTGLDITNSGTAPMVAVNGFDLDVSGAGSSATLTFDDVSSDGHLTGDGYNFLVDGSASLDVTMSNGSTGSNNQGRGLALLAEGADTTVSLTSMTGGSVNTFNNNGNLGGTNNGGHGVDIVLQNGGGAGNPIMADFMLEASANNNAGDGIRVIANDGSGVDIANLGITATNVNVDNNGGNGLTIDLDTVTGITSFDLSGMMVNDNMGDQINVSFSNMMLTDVNLSEIVADGPGAAMGMGDGIELTLDNTAVTNSLGLTNIIAQNNGEDGLQINLLNGASIPAGSSIDLASGVMQNSQFDNNGQHGINLMLNNSVAELDILNSESGFGRTSSQSGNGGNGINITLENGSTLTTSIDQQIIDSNGGSGIMVSTSGASTFNSGNSITNNTITNNSGFGIRGIFLGGDFDLSIGSRNTADQGNLIDNNADAGIAIDMIQDTTGQIAILDNEITNTSNGTDAAFNGEAIFIRMLGTLNPTPASNTLNASGTAIGDNLAPGLLISGNNIGVDSLNAAAGNNGTGIMFDVREESVIDGLFVMNNTISNSATGDGLNFTRIDEVTVNDFFIDENTFENNSDDGIEIIGENDDNSAMMVVIGIDGQRDINTGVITGTDADVRTDIANWLNSLDGNVVSGNGNDGMAFQVNADAGLTVNMQENMITENGSDGIQMTEIAIAGDSRVITGLWDQNVVADNNLKGLRMRANTGNATGITFQDGIIGAVLDQFGSVMIEGNGSTGAYLFGSGTYAFDDVDFIRNGVTDTGNTAQGHGLDIEGVVSNVTVTDSLFRENFQDGIEIRSGGTATETTTGGTLTFTQTGFAMNVDLTDNRIVDNRGRGVDVINAMDSLLNLTIAGTDDPRGGNPSPNSQVSSNDEEGIYIVNTASQSQDQNSPAGDDLAADGAVTRDGHINASITQTQISNNGNDIPGQANNLPASGLIVRVGTMDGNYSLLGGQAADYSDSQAGGFASDGNSVGGVVLTVHSNNLQGNFGDDIFFHSFTSTVDPTTIGGTWNDMTFTPNNTGRGDPLARLDVIWGVDDGMGNNLLNTFDTVRLLNTGRDGTAEGQAGAFYDNADAFKSKPLDSMTPSIGGPFTSTSRRRNATRLALRNYRDFIINGEMVTNVDFLRPTATPNPNTAASPFLYPGMGDSTFRAQATSGDNLDLVNLGAGANAGNGFDSVFFDDDPRIFGDFVVDDINDLFGVGFTGSIAGEEPFGWGAF